MSAYPCLHNMHMCRRLAPRQHRLQQANPSRPSTHPPHGLNLPLAIWLSTLSHRPRPRPHRQPLPPLPPNPSKLAMTSPASYDQALLDEAPEVSAAQKQVRLRFTFSFERLSVNANLSLRTAILRPRTSLRQTHTSIKGKNSKHYPLAQQQSPRNQILKPVMARTRITRTTELQRLYPQQRRFRSGKREKA